MTNEEIITLKRNASLMKTLATNIEKVLNNLESVGTQKVSKKIKREEEIRKKAKKQFAKNLIK